MEQWQLYSYAATVWLAIFAGFQLVLFFVSLIAIFRQVKQQNKQIELQNILIEQQTKQLEQQVKQVEQQTIQIDQQTTLIEQQTRLAQAAHTQSLFEISSPFNINFIQDRRFAEIVFEGHEHYQNYDSVDQARYRTSLIWRLGFQEMTFFQYKNGLISAEMYDSWHEDFKIVVKRRRVSKLWGRLNVAFTEDFISYVNDIIKESSDESAESSNKPSDEFNHL
jgi:hypothetical protein